MRARDEERGYSLLEVLVALAIMAMATAFALPGLTAGLSSASRHTATLDLHQQISALRASALREDTTLVLMPHDATSGEQTGEAEPSSAFLSRAMKSYSRTGDTPDEALFAGELVETRLNAPQGWIYLLDSPLYLRADGTCSAGLIRLQRGLERLAYSIDPLTCEVRRA